MSGPDAFDAFEQAGWADNDPAAYEQLFGPITSHPIERLLDAGAIETTGDDLIVAVFADTRNQVPLAPGAGAKLVTHDDAFTAMMEELPGSTGMYTPTASGNRNLSGFTAIAMDASS